MAQFNWIDAGVAGLSLTDSLLGTLVAKGLLTDQERGQVIDTAIERLVNAPNQDVAQAADTLRALFNRS